MPPAYQRLAESDPSNVRRGVCTVTSPCRCSYPARAPPQSETIPAVLRQPTKKGTSKPTDGAARCAAPTWGSVGSAVTGSNQVAPAPMENATRSLLKTWRASRRNPRPVYANPASFDAGRPKRALTQGATPGADGGHQRGSAGCDRDRVDRVGIRCLQLCPRDGCSQVAGAEGPRKASADRHVSRAQRMSAVQQRRPAPAPRNDRAAYRPSPARP